MTTPSSSSFPDAGRPAAGSPAPAYHPATSGDPGLAGRTGPILVATDGDSAAPVMAAATALAARLGAEPEVVAVQEPIVTYMPAMGMEAVLPDVQAEQRALLLERVGRALAAAGDPPWRLHVVDGQPARTIAHVAHERMARMVVLGIGHHAAVDRLLGTETALETIRLADRPVLAVAPSFEGLPRQAVVAMDFSPSSVRAAEEALALLAGGGTLTLVHAHPHLEDLAWSAAEPASRSLARRLDRMFDRVIALLGAPGSVTVRSEAVAGDPAEQVLRVAEREGAALVASGSSGVGFFERLVVGSVTTRLLRHATVSVLVVPRPSPAEVERIERGLGGDWPGKPR